MSRSLLASFGVLGRELASPSHSGGCGFRVVPELLSHPGRATALTEPAHRGRDRLGDHVGGRGVGWLQRGDEQRFVPHLASWLLCRLWSCSAVHVASAPSVPGPRPRRQLPARGLAGRIGRITSSVGLTGRDQDADGGEGDRYVAPIGGIAYPKQVLDLGFCASVHCSRGLSAPALVVIVSHVR